MLLIAHAHTHTHTHALISTHTGALSLAHTHTHTLTRTHTHTHTHSLAHTHTRSRSHLHTHTPIAWSILTVFLLFSLAWGCGCAVLYEVLDDSPDDMNLDWFQGQIYPGALAHVRRSLPPNPLSPAPLNLCGSPLSFCHLSLSLSFSPSLSFLLSLFLSVF